MNIVWAEIVYALVVKTTDSWGLNGAWRTIVESNLRRVKQQYE